MECELYKVWQFEYIFVVVVFCTLSVSHVFCYCYCSGCRVSVSQWAPVTTGFSKEMEFGEMW